MKKRTLHLLGLGMIICLSLTACNSSTTTETEESQSTIAESTSESETVTSESEPEDATEFATDTAHEVSADIPEGLYRDFLTNKTKVQFTACADPDTAYDYLPIAGHSYTLQELTDLLIENYTSEEQELIATPSTEYALIDCGKDGTPELALQINATLPMDEWNHLFVLKEKDGALEAVYCTLGWSRSTNDINQCGYISHFGSGGAATSYYAKAFVDGDGDYHFLYSNIVDGWNGLEKQLTDTKGHKAEDFVYLGFAFEEGTADSPYYPVSSYGFLDSDSDIRERDELFTAYSYQPIKYDDSIYESGYCIKDYLESEGVKVYNIKDVEQMIADKEKTEGLTAEIKNAPMVEWTTLE